MIEEELELEQNHFTIVILSYNNEKWVEKNVNSAINQIYENFDIKFVDDASTDKTGKKAEKIFSKLIQENESLADRIQVIRNETNKKALANLYRCVSESKPGSIIVALDGDDWLGNRFVLRTLNEVYQNPKVWITAGSYIESVGGKVVRPKVSDDYWDGNIRHKEWSFSHLRTFKRELFLSINKEDMMDSVDGDFYKFTWDRVIMYPMIEMAGRNHFKPVMNINYVYNRENPLAVDRVHRHNQLRIEAELKQKTPHKRLKELPSFEQV